MSLNHSTQADFSAEVTTLAELPDGRSVVPEAGLLFNASFQRAGQDLLLVNDGAATLRVPDYFADDEPADLLSPEGAVLRGDVIVRLAGPVAPGQYAQLEPGSGGNPIGQVETLSGTASVQRTDGVVEQLQVGMKIFEDDVVQTGGDGSVSVTFVDGTIFTLAASSRMIIDELIYDPDGTDNSGSFSLVQGGFVFIAGQVARTGGIDVNTPSATMGIRGTTVLVDVQTDNGVTTTEVTLTRDPDGDIGRVVLLDANGNLIANVTGIETKWIISPIAGETREVDRSLQDDASDNVLIAEVVAAFQSAMDRVAQGETFVTLGGAENRNVNDGPGDQPGSGLEVDPLDEPGGIEPPPAPAPGVPGNGPADGSIDEGQLRNLPDVEAPDVRVAGLEDLGVSGTISGFVTGGSTGGSTAVYALVTGPQNGLATVLPDGSFDYEPNANFNGTDTFTYTATDTDGAVETGTVTVVVAPVNDAPVANNASTVVAEDGTVTGIISATDIDGDTLVFSLRTGAANGLVVITANGAYAYTPDPDFEGTDSFVVAVSDPSGASADSTVTVTVTGTNDAPVVTTAVGSERGAVVEDGTAQVSGRLSATDPDSGAVLTWSGSATGEYGGFAIAADGTWSYTLDPAAAQQLGAGQSVQDVFTATVTDDIGAAAQQDVTVTVTGTNDAPVVTQNTVLEVLQDTPFSGVLGATDVDSAGPLVFTSGSLAPSNGTVQINPDGSFEFTPVSGFLGIDRFSYEVSDGDGGVTTGTVTVEIESGSQSGAQGQDVTVSISTVAGPGDPAGGVFLDATSADANGINIVFALDRSGSIGANGWEIQTQAVAGALEQLAARFEGSATQVNVQVVAYASSVETTGVFDLQDPGLTAAVTALPYTGGFTYWDLALSEAKTFFDAQPADGANYLYFVTDGNPTTDAWQPLLSELTDEAATGYSVQIEAFGIGSGWNQQTLGVLDPAPTVLESADDLASALTESPIFNAQLQRLEISLEADGVDRGVIADQDSPALVRDGIDYDLAFADIADIETLIGATNRFSARAFYDLDGDPATSEIELFTTEVMAKASVAQTLTGENASDFLLGSDLADRISGGGGNDLILGFEGADILNGGAGVDIVIAGGGDDVLIVSDLPVSGRETLNGGAGRDVLSIDLGGDLGAVLFPVLDVTDIEAIDMENGLANSLRLSLSDVVDLSSGADTELETLLNQALPESATIYGDASDSLVLMNGSSGGFLQSPDAPVVDASGNTLVVFQYVDGGNVLATLGVDAEVSVSIAAPAA
jgi:VCBS repeat-containing protein